MRVPLGLGLLSFGLAFLQRPGESTSDTKIDLHVDAAGFLGDVASVWSGTGDLGHVQSGQYSGYLFPMAPFFALGEQAGLPDWVVHRLWLGTVLALAAWGMVRLLDELYSRDRGVAHVIGGALIVLNPYVVTFSNRTSVTLLGYAALPWLLIAVARGVRAGRNWWWPAFFGVVLACTGGGVNAAVTAWVVAAPALFLLYEWRVRGAPGGEVRAFAWRTAVAASITSLWWVLPVAVHARFGLDFLPFTEGAGAIWGTTSLPESLRSMGYWISYLGVGYGESPIPYFTNVQPLLFDLPVVAATLLVPGLAVAGLVWTARRDYAPFFLMLLLAGLVVMSVGWPEGTPLRRLVTGTYNHVDAVQFLRTTYKAGPLVAVSVAWLGAVAAAEGWRRLGGARARLAASAAAVALVGLSAWPLVTGRAIDPLVSWDSVPGYWDDAAADLDEDLPANSRTVMVPGQLYGFYDWGATVDPVLPALTERPVAVATVPPYSDLRAVDLLWSVDSLVRQRRLVLGQLGRLLGLMGAGAVVTTTDDDFERSGAPPPAVAAEVLRDQGFVKPDHAYGEPRLFRADTAEASPPVRLPRVRRYDLAADRPLVRALPAAPVTIVDGSAAGLAQLAAFDQLPTRAPLLYAADVSVPELREAARAGAQIVVTDSNRRRVLVSARPRQNVGATLPAGEDPPGDAAVLDPFPDVGTEAQTVAVVDGVRHIRAPFSPGFPQFPENRPFAAIDGDPRTYWVADINLARARHKLELRLNWSRSIPYIELLPQRYAFTDVTAVKVNGRRYRIHPGWNRLRIDTNTDRLEVNIDGVREPKGFARGPGAIAELRVPGVKAREWLRPPLLAERALLGSDLRRASLVYAFSRQSGDDPFRRSPPVRPERRGGALEDVPIEQALVARPGDAERDFVRSIAPPSKRSYRVDAWLALADDATEAEVDRLTGTAGAGQYAASGRLHGLPRHSASAAFDGDPATGWADHYAEGAPPWLEWRGESAVALRDLRLAPLPGFALPERVMLAWEGGSAPVTVAKDGRVSLPRRVLTSRLRVTVRTLASGDADVAAIAEIEAAGLPRALRGTGAVSADCGSVWVEGGSTRLPLRPTGTIADLMAGRPLRARSCAGELRLPAGSQQVRTGGSVFAIEHLLLASAPPLGGADARSGGGRVVDAGDAGRGSRDGVRLALDGPSWLVLGESYNRGWRAWCGDRSLGEPTPIDGYANGWRVDEDCESARFEFAPNRLVMAGFIGSGAACLVALLLLLLFVRRRPRATGPGAQLGEPPAWRVAPMGLPRAAAIALACAVAIGGGFGLRAGAVALPLLTLLLWRGVGTRALLAAAGALLAAVVPLIYVVFPPDSSRGYNPSYAADLIGAHWVAVAAWVLLAVALVRLVSTASPPSGARAGGSAGGASARSGP